MRARCDGLVTDRCATDAASGWFHGRVMPKNRKFFIMLKTYRKRKNGVVERKIGDELVLVDSHNGYVHQLNETGACIWRNLMDDVSLETLAEIVCREFEVDAETARRDVDGFISELSRLKMIEEQTA